MSNRDRILETALRLFNAAGTSAVSTNHIAEALGISPGNLYYHFRNKEEIIRALAEQQFAQWDSSYTFPTDRAPSLDDVRGVVRATFEVNWTYRFFYRELIALQRRDPELGRRWGEVRARGYAGFQELMEFFVRAGVLRDPGDDAVVTRLADLCWLVGEFWLASVEAAGEPVDAVAFERGVALMNQILDPYAVTAGAA